MNESLLDHPPAQTSVDAMDPDAEWEPLDAKSFLMAHDDDTGPRVSPPDIHAMQALIEKANCESTPYQSVAVTAVQILEQALRSERKVAEAALSLGQQEKLTSMVEMADQAVSALRDTLSEQGHKVMHLCAEQSASPSGRVLEASDQSWEPVLASALEMLEEGTDRMMSLTTGQPPGSPVRELSQLVAHLLRSHHDVLLMEAEEWSA